MMRDDLVVVWDGSLAKNRGYLIVSAHETQPAPRLTTPTQVGRIKVQRSDVGVPHKWQRTYRRRLTVAEYERMQASTK